MHTQQEAVRAKCAVVFAKAKEFYPHLNFDKVSIHFNLKGRAAGMAGLLSGRYFVRFNADMITREAINHILNDTVPHEIAHIVCYMDQSLGNKHDYGWAQVCRKLGGSGDRYHHEEVVYAKGNTYEYTSSTGVKQRLSQQRHNRVQQGGWCEWRNGGGRVDKNCEFTIVGAQGRTLKTPVAPKQHYTDPTVNFNKAIKEFTDEIKTYLPPKSNVVFENLDKTISDAIGMPAALAKGTNTGTDQISPGFGKDAVIDIPKSVPTVARTIVTPAIAGESKAATSRRIMITGYQQNLDYETVIAQMMTACGYNRQLARATYKANAAKIGIAI